MRIDFLIAPAIPKEIAEEQASYARGLGLSPPRPRGGALAVVGGGHSAEAYVETLRRFKGDVWAVNGAYGWCRDHKIEATFFTVDPEEITVKFAKGAEKAIVTPWCYPTMWEALTGDVELADFVPIFSASAPNAGRLGVELGYRSITYFGCDCSFSDTTHTYQNNEDPMTMVVECGGLQFMTTPAYYIQATEIAALCRLHPLYQERCGGLTRALCQNEEHDIVWSSPGVQKLLGTVTFSELEIVL